MAEIDHLGIAVRSVAVSRRFYEALGLEVARTEEIAGEGVRTATIPTGGGAIELLEPTAEDTPVGRFLARRGEGLHHLALRVADISAEFERMKREGVNLISDNIGIGAGGHFYFFVHPSSAGGVLLEICQDPVTGV